MYTVYRTPIPPLLNGDLTQPVWRMTPRSPRFCDMVTGQPGWFDTRAALLWDDHALYAAFAVEERFLEAHLTERDSLIFLENDVELFLDGGDCYYEFEINARGTIYEVFFIWQDAYKTNPAFAAPEFDIRSRRAVSFGGDYDRTGEHFWRGTHPRGLRWAFLDWDFPGLRSAVHLDGTLNDNRDIDRGWTVEIALPWSGFGPLANGRSLPPQDGDEWRLFLGRFQKLMPGGRELQPHPAWVWSPHGVYDTHQPQMWTPVRFSLTQIQDLPA